MGLSVATIRKMIELGLTDEDIQAYIDGWGKRVPKTSPTPPNITISELDNEKGSKGSVRGRSRVERGTRIPPDFSITEEMMAWATQHEGFDETVVRREGENFVDYWTSASTQRAIKCDWVKAWKVWMRRVADGGQRLREKGSMEPTGTPEERYRRAQIAFRNGHKL